MVLLAGLLALSAACGAQTAQRDAGRTEFESHCAICHGDNGRGNGEMRKFLTRAPTDLTTMSKRNGGAFPNQLAWEIIDGRSEIGPHGTRAMPVWGRQYRYEALASPTSANEPEWYVRNRIVALLDYLSRIQER
jgi:mono/diheme cytochrome c family protein